MLPYDLIIIEEVGQLSQALFERIMQLWEAADQLPTIVLVGDFWQLPGVEPTNAKDSPMWHSVRVKKRKLYTMHRCKCKELQHKLDILLHCCIAMRPYYSYMTIQLHRCPASRLHGYAAVS